MLARFVGGTWDGRSEVVARAPRLYMVAVRPTTARAIDFLNLDYKAEYKTERYRRTAFDRETETATYEYEGNE
jgi:hypothetical protein